MHWEYQASVQN